MNHIDIKEFREAGHVQEINRRYLHPLGMALEVTVEEDGSEHLSGVWDYRDDPEGVRFEHLDASDRERAAAIDVDLVERSRLRRAALGYLIQPFDD